MKRISIFLIISFFSSQLIAQNTVGLLSYNPEKTSEGYNLLYAHNQENVYLLDNCGEIVHTWVDSIYKPGNTAFILNNGDLIRTGGRGPASNMNIHAGGGGEMVERRNWDGDLLWRYFYNDSLNRMHHDIAILPNENILVLAWEKKSREEAIAAGRDTTKLTENELWPEHIIELKPIGTDSAEIVWRWNVWDHLIQDFDSTKENYGVVADHPLRIDINYDNNDGKADWLHANSIDYSPDMDQILLSIPYFNEIWIIDHSTTTEEAATSSGGLCDYGGDLMYRWGNPQAYQKGDSTDQKLFFQHDAHWLDLNLPNTDPNFGKIGIFNNRVDDSYSKIGVLNPFFDDYSCKYTFTNTFQPNDLDWSYVHPDTNKMYTRGLGGLQRLENGNTLISSGRQGYIFEIDNANEVVWEYEVPLIAGNPVAQGTTPNPGQNLIFRTYRYPLNYDGFSGKDLSKKGYLELDPDTVFCQNIIGTDEYEVTPNYSILPNPVSSHFYIDFKGNKTTHSIKVYNLRSQLIYEDISSENHQKITCNQWEPGVYIVRIDEVSTTKIVKL
ncbi:MAG: aryl-sulfate sulfotransferase [Flavobacteriales bacterium]